MKSGAGAGPAARGFSLRDVLLSVQIALCTLLVTASLVALRGMERSLHARLGFQPQSVMLAETQLNMGGYAEDQWPPVQRRMAEQAALIPGVSAAGVIDRAMLDNDCCGSEAVVEDGKYQTITEEAAPAMFFPLAQDATGYDTVLVVRSLSPANDTAAALRSMLSGIGSEPS
jgi:hypothetical protein